MKSEGLNDQPLEYTLTPLNHAYILTLSSLLYTWTLSFHLRLITLRNFFPSGFPTTILNELLIFFLNNVYQMSSLALITR